MLIPNHPHDERLSALASADADATADEMLTSHVASCVRCTETVTELGALRASLASLPDLKPSRPLRLIPEATEAPAGTADRLAGWVRRVFAPVLAAGATLAMVGLVGTGAPMLQGAGGADSAAILEAENSSGAGGEAAPAAASDDRTQAAGQDSGEDGTFGLQTADEDGEDLREDPTEAMTTLPERSPWPMVLFSGVALVIAALLLRWIVVPRAG